MGQQQEKFLKKSLVKRLHNCIIKIEVRMQTFSLTY